MRLVLVSIAFGALGAGCSKQSQDGLPPATEWQASAGAVPPGSTEGPRGPRPGAMGSNPHGGGDPSNPHAGFNMNEDMAGGEGDTNEGEPPNPHAGMATGQNPHTAGGGVDVTKLGLAAPDPNRPIDPNHRVRGVIKIAAKAKDLVKPGTAVFVIVKRANPDGTPNGPPLAVDKLTWSNAGIPFELSDANAMVAGTELTGEVIVTARYDQDSDALSKQPGDVTGQIRVKIPADNVQLELDTILP